MARSLSSLTIHAGGSMCGGASQQRRITLIPRMAAHPSPDNAISLHPHPSHASIPAVRMGVRRDQRDSRVPCEASWRESGGNNRHLRAPGQSWDVTPSVLLSVDDAVDGLGLDAKFSSQLLLHHTASSVSTPNLDDILRC